MLRQIAPIVFNSIKRCYSLSPRHNDKRINSSIDECEKTIKQIESEGPIDFACLEPIGLDWASLPDEDLSHLDALDNLESTEESSNSSKSIKGSESTVSRTIAGQDADDGGVIQHLSSPGDPRSIIPQVPCRRISAGIAQEISDQFLAVSSSNFAGNGWKTNRTDCAIITWDIADLFMPNLGYQRKLVATISSSFYNQLHGVRVLVIPLSSVMNNSSSS
ncbi:unnamed protein product [Adineta ricciae]|uniref:Uncharacterized protein n=1 Tax=Adineta ricciae TaxID=249248 RepID=A0A814TDJ3_ADIRI|nr:unnamed protein product [Adineta ricciae]